MKTLVLGDLHIHNTDTELVREQIKTVLNIVDKEDPDDIVLLGDVIDKRKPSPECLLRVRYLFTELEDRGKTTYVLRGNHDSSTKADDGIAALSLFSSDLTKIIVHTTKIGNRVYAPHYEDDRKIEKLLHSASKDDLLFGHFGYHGCMDSAGICDFNINPNIFRCRAILGHIHRFSEKGNITILGTPYTTNYTESGKKNYYAIIKEDEEELEITYHPITQGPRYLVLCYSELEDNKKLINDDSYFTFLRVLVDQLSDANTANLASELLEKYNIERLDIKFKPLIDDPKSISSYETQRDLFSINEVIIEDYVDNNTTSLDKESIMEGYRILRHEN
mgnify:CR=1 FL=1